jgi:hypothetical protein
MPLHSVDTAQPNECTGIKLCREGSRPPKGRGPADFDGDATLSTRSAAFPGQSPHLIFTHECDVALAGGSRGYAWNSRSHGARLTFFFRPNACRISNANSLTKL